MTFQDIVHQAIDFIEAHWPFFRALSIGSLAFFLITPIIAPLIVLVMPADVLVRARVPLSSRALGFRVFYLLWHIFKNVLGIMLILLGFALLFMPGQGLLTMFVGAMLSDIPRKRSLLQKLLAQHSVRKVTETLRKKAGKAPLIYPEDKDGDSMMKVLFLCTGNSCRSQMAEGWARHLKGELIDAYSAGIETHGLNPNAVKVMAESGVDISGYKSKNSADLKEIRFDAVVTVCGHAHENCPVYLGKSKVVHKGFEDPPKLAQELAEQGASEEEQLDCYRRVRDEIKAYIETLPDALGL